MAQVRIEVEYDQQGSTVRESYFVAAELRVAGGAVDKVIDPAGDSRIEFRTLREAETAVRAAGHEPVVVRRRSPGR